MSLERYHFHIEEYRARVGRVQAHLKELGADVFIADHGELILYLTGHTNSETIYRAVFVPVEGDPWTVIRALDVQPFRNRSWVSEIHGFEDSVDSVGFMAQVLGAKGLHEKVIAVDSRSYGHTTDIHQRFNAALPAASFVSAPDISNQVRWQKSAAEVALLKTSAGIADQAMANIASSFGVGMSARDAAAIAARTFLECGADSGDVGPIVKASGANEFLHASLSGETLASGDLLHVELVPRVRGYSARLMRPILVGADIRGLNDATNALIKLQDQQIAEMKAGAHARDIDSIVRDGVVDLGMRKQYDNATGYTLGLYARTPRTSDFSRVFLSNSDWVLQAGMVFHMYASAAGVAVSETVVVDVTGGYRLGLSPRVLMRAGN